MFYGTSPDADDMDSAATLRDEAAHMDVGLSHLVTASVKFADGEDKDDLVAWLDQIEREMAALGDRRGR